MSKIKVIAEQVMRILGKRTDDSDLDKREVILSVKQSASAIIRKRALEERYSGGDVVSSPDNNIQTYKNLDVLLDEDCKDYYVQLPSEVINLPNGSGIKVVAPMSCPSDSYSPTPTGSMSMMSDLGLDCILGITYYLDGDKIRFGNMDDSNNPSKVLVKLIGGLTEESNIPLDMEDEIIRMTLSLYQAYQPQDETNDQTDIK